MEAPRNNLHLQSFLIDYQQSKVASEMWMRKIREIFQEKIEPFHGSQQKTFQRIMEGKANRCVILYDTYAEIKGIIVYKTQLSNQYEAQGITYSLEVKVLRATEGEEYVASTLIKKVIKIAKAAGAKSIHFKANNKSNLSLEILELYKFVVVSIFPELNKESSSKYLLKLSIEDKPQNSEEGEWQLIKKVEKLSLLDEQSVIDEQPTIKNRSIDRVKVITNVHQDDIHGIIKLADQTFITGSKDGSLKKWDLNGDLIQVISNPGHIDYRNWITALAPLNEESWLSGTRNGNTYLWNNKGECIADLKTRHGPYPATNLRCKQRNVHRVNCLASFNFSNSGLFLMGWPTQFSIHSAETSKRLSYTYTSETDWVYAIHPLSRNSLLVVTGCNFENWQIENSARNSSRWQCKASLVKNEQVYPRPFISAATPLQNADNLYGIAVFDGSVRVIDIQTQETVFRKTEHQKRVWTIENITRSCFASCADDGFIKFWDIRCAKSLFTKLDNTTTSARVSILMLLKDNLLLSGSCPDDVRRARSKAQFSFWDTRSL